MIPHTYSLLGYSKTCSGNCGVGNIMLEVTPTYGSVGGGLVIVSTIDFENDTHLDEIVDVDVFEK